MFQPARPLRADAARNRARVLEVAYQTFAAEGLSVPIDEIARRAGVGAGTVYRHFPTKDELFAVMIRSHEENLASVGLAGKIMKIDIETGKILGSMTSPGHSIHVDASYNIWIGSLTGNALKWTPR